MQGNTGHVEQNLDGSGEQRQPQCRTRKWNELRLRWGRTFD
jgi:hypothetical protein